MAYTRNPNSVFAGTALTQFPAADALDPAGALPVTLHANIATTSTLGVVTIGGGLNVTSSGTVSVVCSTLTTSTDYSIQITDYYIGVDASVATTLTLPLDPPDCIELTVKAQMGPPIGNRKVTVAAQGTNTINGASTYVISIPYESVTVISNGGNWWII